jgi:predicted ester cyclase
MSRRIVAVLAILLVPVLAASALGSWSPDSAAASQATPASEADCPTTTPEENEALVRRYYDEAYNARNTAVIDELLADDFVRHNVAVPQANQPNNADDVARVESWLAAFSDLQTTIEELFATEDTVVSFVVWRGAQDGPLPQLGAPVTGRPMERESLVVWRVACGQLAENWIVQDNLTMLRQLGIITDDELTTAGTPTVATPTP